MPLPRDQAEAALSLEVTGLGQPSPDTPEWWLQQAKSLGLTLLREWRKAGLETPSLAQKHRQELRKRLGI